MDQSHCHPPISEISFVPDQPCCPPPVNPIAVVGPQFCAPYNVTLTVAEKLMSLGENSFGVLDFNGNLVFQIKGRIFGIHDRRLMVDVLGNPIITLKQKIFTAHGRWQVFRGESSDHADLLFSVKKAKLLQLKAEYNVFLAANTKEEVPDFKIKGSWMKKSCIITTGGDSPTILGQMHKEHGIQSIALGKKTYSVTAYPHVDYAFITALVVILNEANSKEEKSSHRSGGGHGHGHKNEEGEEGEEKEEEEESSSSEEEEEE